MSTCPENDIHSVYLDGELPEEFVAEYEAHVATCPECAAKLEKLTELKDIFHEDSDSLKISQKHLDDSFLRLQAKMKYMEFKKAEKQSSVSFSFTKFRGLQYFAAGIAAAALVAFVLPHKNAGTSVASETAFSPVARSASASSVKPVMIDRNIDAVHLASFLGGEDSSSSLIAVPADEKSLSVQKMILEDSGNYGNSSVVKPALADYDVFAPLDEENKNLHETEHVRGFTFSVSSPFLNVSFQVGK